MPSILSLYIARRLLVSVAVTFAALFALIYLIDFVDLIKDMKPGTGATLVDVVLLGFERTPVIAEEVFPFTVLFASIAAFITLSRKMELVVARATGVSVWQMLAPALIAAALLGIAVTALYNPVSTRLKEISVEHEASAFGKARSDSSSNRWIRQQSDENQSILRATRSTKHGRVLRGVTAFVFTPGGAFQARVEAPTAVLKDGYWELESARVMRHGTPPESHPVYKLATNLTPAQVADTVTSAETVSFWELPGVISQWRNAGLKSEKFELRYQSLIARPMFYVAMVVIAATVSLGFSRLGGLGRAILGGVLAGFMLYVSGEMAGDLGAAGIITPFVAAWAPAIVGTLLGVTVLLHQEDG